MSQLEIHLASAADEAELLAFIDRHWRAGHIFVRHPELLRWQHAAHDGSRVHFVVARGGETRAILGILGYIPLRHFDLALSRSDLFLAIWKVRDDAGLPGLGISLLNFLRKTTVADLVAAVGLTQMVLPIYRALGYEVGRLRHHVLFNPAVERFLIAAGPIAGFRPAPFQSNGRLVTADAGILPAGIAASDIHRLCEGFLPQKSWPYLVARYSNHPAYSYRFSSAIEARRLRCLLVWRKIAARGSAALRIVDLLGDESALAKCAGDLQTLLQAEQAEYIDIQHYGVAPAALVAAGFIDRQQTPALIVPGHFEPFEARNVDLDFAYKRFDKSSDAPVRLLRGDSDQDRPNQL